ncbi:adenosylcobinamide-GDP ribazoletransferase [Nocardiopsis sp. MG754419]|uniref:adenosylcobinamide-GDP ribazoletransferase n=1 Tax=Nocardiopsis sp. MG754419 TaxID=2259865 RepID=UPI001BAD98FF|nr:adenosylcobinamide-GDP ribazoletransferase [Nocardiopsis sp. MG754419]MBR8744408.1 adenosylcobinamide-GDP ribazoletransferase [Nocardiopsis sp. MG754419]
MSAANVTAGLRMAVGTFTVWPVRVTRVDRAVAGRAMLWAPVLGALVGAVMGLVTVAGTWLGWSAALAALTAVGAAALLTRGLHLDGLADLADGLGSARPAEGALEVMRRSDIGPFGVLTLVVTVGAQALALAQLAEVSAGAVLAGAVSAGAAGRLAATWACGRRIPSARPDGLGAFVAGTVGAPAAVACGAGVLALCALGLLHSPGFALACAAGVVLGVLVAGGLLWHAVRRLGGITGDVLGALVECAATTVLLTVAAASAWT